jgi:hypothetical protein
MNGFLDKYAMNETQMLLVNKLFREFDSKMYVDWAIALMEQGYESESLFILAGLDNDDTETREKYFEKTVNELSIKIDYDNARLIDDYAIYIARKVVSKAISPAAGLKVFQHIVIESGYDDKYYSFHELDLQMDGNQFCGYMFDASVLPEGNVELYIYEEFQLFLELVRLENFDTRKLFECTKCRCIGKGILKTKYRFKWPRKYSIWVCGNCKSDKISGFYSHKTAWRIIDYIQNHP